MSKVFYFLCNLSRHTFSAQPGDPAAAARRPPSFQMSVILGRRWPINEVDICYCEGFTMQSWGKGSKGLLGAYRRGGKVTANLKGTRVIYPYTPE